MTAFQVSNHKNKNCSELHMTNGLALDVVAPVKLFTFQIFSLKVEPRRWGSTFNHRHHSMWLYVLHTRVSIYIWPLCSRSARRSMNLLQLDEKWKLESCEHYLLKIASEGRGKPVGSILSCHAPTSPTHPAGRPACKVPVWHHHLEFPDFISKGGDHI